MPLHTTIRVSEQVFPDRGLARHPVRILKRPNSPVRDPVSTKIRTSPTSVFSDQNTWFTCTIKSPNGIGPFLGPTRDDIPRDPASAPDSARDSREPQAEQVEDSKASNRQKKAEKYPMDVVPG